jgi:hypothetical protein
VSLYEGRTRGKRTKYTFSDDEDMGSDEPSTKRSRTSGISTPGESFGPVVTASGRQVKARGGGVYGESLLIGQRPIIDGIDDDESEPRTRTRSGRASGHARIHRAYERQYEEDDEMDEDSDAPSSEWNSDKNDDGGDDAMPDVDNEDEDMSEDLDQGDVELLQQSKVVTLRVGKATASKIADSKSLEVSQPNGEVQTNHSTIVLDKSIGVNGESTADREPDISSISRIQNAESVLENSGSGYSYNPSTYGKLSRSPQLPQPESLATKIEDLKPLQTPTPPLSDIQLHNGKAEASSSA